MKIKFLNLLVLFSAFAFSQEKQTIFGGLQFDHPLTAERVFLEALDVFCSRANANEKDDVLEMIGKAKLIDIFQVLKAKDPENCQEVSLLSSIE